MTLSTPSEACNVSVASTINSIHSSSQLSRHDSIRKKATENYVAPANKKRKLYDDHLTTLAEGLKLGDCVGIKIHEVDRTTTDPKILPCLIVWKEKKHEDYVFKIVCQFGQLDKGFGIESLIPMQAACPVELKSLKLDELKDISLIEASKLFVRGSVNGATCDCKSLCATKHCPCKKANVKCSTKCHSKKGDCKNKE
ncbi:unnamed protein product [Didymodactylos carnosus]|uniref:Uncharacterized protein n=1 Tax=Didymodactylos carnosus TaxID=1234261 RepID=A0A8S2FIZ4_9BILA|nr:unnamed protein product [Didymodactylos carnosus]CAF4271220.1 unnamed protein product [Didymodactylos carnosus]